MEFGLRHGLAQDFGYDQQINDLRYNEQLNKQAKITAENKAKMFADDFEYNNAMNQHDNPLVKQFAQFQIKRIGQFINQNPDWETNVQKRAEYKQLIHELKDNPDLNRGMQSDKSYSMFQADLAEKSKNPELYDAEAYNDIANQWKNYIKYGNQYATSDIEAAKLGKAAFVYNQPQDWVNLQDAGLEAGNKFNDFKISHLPGGGPGSYMQVPKEDSLLAGTTDFYNRNKRQMDIQAKKYGYRNPIEYAKKLYQAGIKTKFDYGDMRLAYEMQKDKKGSEPVVGNYKIDIVDKDKGIVNSEILKDAFGPRPQNLKIRSRDGKDFVDLSGREANYTGHHVYFAGDKSNGIKHFAVTVLVPIEDAVEKGQIEKSFRGSYKVSPEWIGKVSIKEQKDKDDNPVFFAEYSDFIPIEFNATAAGIYDSKSTINKYVQAPSSEYQTKKQVFRDENGDKWVEDGKGGYAPYKQ